MFFFFKGQSVKLKHKDEAQLSALLFGNHRTFSHNLTPQVDLTHQPSFSEICTCWELKLRQNPPTTMPARDSDGFTPSPGRTTQQAGEMCDSLTGTCSEASCCLSLCLTTARPDLRWLQFRLVHPPGVCVFILHEDISALSAL